MLLVKSLIIGQFTQISKAVSTLLNLANENPPSRTCVRRRQQMRVRREDELIRVREIVGETADRVSGECWQPSGKLEKSWQLLRSLLTGRKTVSGACAMTDPDGARLSIVRRSEHRVRVPRLLISDCDRNDHSCRCTGCTSPWNKWTLVPHCIIIRMENYWALFVWYFLNH